MEIKVFNRYYWKISPVALKGILALTIFAVFAGCASRYEILDPYEKVDWGEYGQYKAIFHVHTTRSDGRMNPHTVVDIYHSLGYDVLAIADHNEVTYPWTAFSEIEPSNGSVLRFENRPETMPESLIYEDRDPDALGMIAIQANELSSHHHMGSFFNDHNNTTTEEESLEGIGLKNGLAMFFHPGRYNNPIEWYVDLYQRYDHLIGLEVYNTGNLYTEDRKIWDSILTVTMPGRPVWGYSNDDMHFMSQLGRNWNMLILPELTNEWVRYGMENGLSYFIYAPGGYEGPPPPVIESITVNKRKGSIEISAGDCDSIKWISGGHVVHEGAKILVDDLPDPVVYIRAKLYGPGETVSGTQPFGIRKK